MVADSERIPLGVVPTGDTEAIQHLRSAIAGDRHWFIALLEAMGMWVSTEEKHNGRTYRYLVDGEAFDWLLLAERLCEAADGIIPAGEHGILLVVKQNEKTISEKILVKITVKE